MVSKLAIISDVHSNLEALIAVLNDISNHSVAKIISLGDNVGYGPDPEEVLIELRDQSVKSILGNHEYAILNNDYKKSFSINARKALHINCKKLSGREKQYISTFDSSLELYGAFFTHGISSNLIDGYISKLSDTELIKRTKEIKECIAFVGHTHQLKVYEFNNETIVKKEFTQKTPISSDKKYIINIGSVGQPRHGGHEATYVIWDTQLGVVEPRLVTYDYHSTAIKIKQAGLPQIYAEML